MTDLDLEKLARRAAPPADASARAAALAAAMQAFDDAEKNPDATQGSIAGGRQSSIFNRIWSPIMNRKFLAGSALATLLVVPVAGLVTYELVRNGTVPLTTETQIAAKSAGEDQRARKQEKKAAEVDADEIAAQVKDGEGAQSDLKAKICPHRCRFQADIASANDQQPTPVPELG